jgi:hypothetical protein
VETLHTVLRAMRRNANPKRDHLKIFREFLAHLDRTGAANAAPETRKARGPRKRRVKA